MRKILSAVLILGIIIAVIVTGAPFTANAEATRVELLEKVSFAKSLYFSGGSEQTRKYLYSKLAEAQDVLSNNSVKPSQITASYKKLKKAIEDFKPISVNERIAVNGIGRWNTAQVSAMEAKGIKASLSDAFGVNEVPSLTLTLLENTGSFFNLPGEDGAFSPFGTDMNGSDGLAFWVSANEYSKVSSIEFYVGTRSAEKDELLSVYDIPVKEEGYIYIPWEIFYPEVSSLEASIDLNGNMNRIGFIVNGDVEAEVYISDIHAFCEQIEEDRRKYEERRISSVEELKNDGLYKLVDSLSGKTVTFGPEHTETEYRSETRIAYVQEGQSFTLEKNLGNSVTQQWQIYKLAKSGKYHIINQGTSAAMTNEFSQLTLQMNLDLDNEAQRTDVYSSNGKFSFKVDDRYLGISQGVPTLTSEKYAQWEVYECITDEWVEVWSDEFNGTEIDRTKWNVANGKVRGDTEPTTFRDHPNNLYFEDGNLVIKSIVEEYEGYHATSGYMDTRGLFAATYGKLEMRARLTYGSRVWPAFWAMGLNGNWPYNGEIDIMEFDGDGGAGDYEYSIYATNHWFYFDRFTHAAKGITLQNEEDEPFSEQFHTFSVEWDENQVRTYVDGMLYMSMMLSTDELRWSFGDNPHYLILNTSMKGPGDNQLYEDTVEESFFYIDYVRCYKRSSEISDVPTPNDRVVDKEFAVSANGWMTTAEASPDGMQVIVAARTGFFIIDPRDNTVENYITIQGSEISKIKYSADGTLFAVADRTGIVFVYDRYTHNLVSTISVPTVYIEGMEFSADCKYIYFSGALNAEGLTEPTEENYSLKLYRGNIEKQNADASVFIGSNVRNIALSPDSSLLAAVCADGKVLLLDVTDGLSIVKEYVEHKYCVRGVTWSGDGQRFATSDENGEIFIRYIDEESIIKAQNVSTSSARLLSYSPSGDKLLAAGSGESARVFDGRTGELLFVIGGFSQFISAAQWSADGRHILLMSGDGYGRIYTEKGEYVCTLDGRLTGCSTFMGAVFSNDGKRVYAVTGAPLAETYCWDISKYITDSSELKNIYLQVQKSKFTDYTTKDYAELSELFKKYENLLRSPNITQKKLDAASEKLKKAFGKRSCGLFAFNSRIFLRES